MRRALAISFALTLSTCVGAGCGSSADTATGGDDGGAAADAGDATSQDSAVAADGDARAVICGDGVVDGTEQCDDGNTNNGDGCGANCQVEQGFTCSGSPYKCSCMPGVFIACAGMSVVSCNATGNGSTTFGCGGGGCNGGMGIPGCGQCASSSCTSGTPGNFVVCDAAHGVITASGACKPTVGASAGKSEFRGMACAECLGNAVCGDGMNHGTAVGSSYACSQATLGAATVCGFGCDAQNGLCRDLIPASQAAAHLASADTFTCTGAQDPMLPAVSVSAGTTVTIDTSAKTITVGGVQVTGVKWGAVYQPTGSGTTAIVAHVKSVAMSMAGKVSVTGAYALVLLVDQDFVVANNNPMGPTVISVAADTYVTRGPGAPSSTAGGAGSLGGFPSTQGSGGAGHGGHGGQGGTGNNRTVNQPGTAGGSPYGIAAQTETLEAGENGGAEQGPSGVNFGGLGGGALQVTACGRIDLSAGVIVNASGGGGQGDHGIVGQGGGGGGSGGSILLEAAVVHVAGSLVSNGGGGGSGGTCSTADGANWGGSFPLGPNAMVAAPGGSCGGGDGNGGNGGAGTNVDGQQPSGATSAPGFGGGGGGAVGAIFLNVPTGTTATYGLSSPTPRTSTVCLTSNGMAPTICAYP